MTVARGCLACFALACLAACTDAAGPPPATRQASRGPRPELAITRIGPIEVVDRARIDLPAAPLDVAGRCWNYDAADETAVLVRSLENGPWTVAAASAVEPGGLFQVAGVRFPGSGDFQVAAALLGGGRLAAGGRVPAASLGSVALALSPTLLVRVIEPPRPPETERPDREVVSVGGRALAPQGPTLVPAVGDVVLRARAVGPGERVFLAVVSPASGHASLHGPAFPEQKDEYLLPGVSLETRGDPRNVHLGLLAVVSGALAAGPLDLAWLGRGDSVSASAEVVVDDGPEAGSSRRVPFIAVSRVGGQEVPDRKPADRPAKEPEVAAGEGDAVEVGRYERVPEGASVWILTRPQGSGRWLAQGPALLRGQPSTNATVPDQPAAVWVWPDTRFEREAADEAEGQGGDQGGDAPNFEVRAVLSTARLAEPCAWIEAGSLASLTISEAVLVKVKRRDARPLPPPQVSIDRIGDAEPDPEGETEVGATARVEVSARRPSEQEPGARAAPPWRVYLAWHPMGEALWSLREAVPRGSAYVAPAVAFADGDAAGPERFEVMAVATRDGLPEPAMEYSHLVRAVAARSELVALRHEPEGMGIFGSGSLQGWGLPVPRKGTTVTWIRTLLLFLLPAALVAALVWLAGRRGALVAPLAERIAGRLHRTASGIHARLVPLKAGKVALFVLGLGLAAAVLYVIVHYYVPLYTTAMESVTSLPHRESAGLAVWLILLTALAGIYLELATEPEHGLFGDRDQLRVVISLSLAIILIGLAGFQGLFYFAFLSSPSNQGSGASTPLAGGIAFFLIASIEALTFFFVTRLTLPHAGAVAMRCTRWLVLLVALCFGGLAVLCREAQRGGARSGEPAMRSGDLQPAGTEGPAHASTS